jgi:hypothetical protein
MSEIEKQPYEDRTIRCPKLGGMVWFQYCEAGEGESACPKALDCWAPVFDVEGFFRGRLTPEDFENCFMKPPTPKIVTLMDLIEQAKKLTM